MQMITTEKENEKEKEKESQLVETMKKKGKKELSTNIFFNDMNDLMHNEGFKTFYDKYFRDSSDIKSVLIYLKLYETLQMEYKERHNVDIDEEVLIYIIKELMVNKTSRQNILQSFDTFFSHNTLTVKSSQTHKYKYLLDVLSPQIQDQLQNQIYRPTNILSICEEDVTEPTTED